jgi:hypothetical protein
MYRRRLGVLPGVHDAGGCGMDEAQRLEAGLKTRREVLGADYVDRALANADEFTRPFQEFVSGNTR